MTRDQEVVTKGSTGDLERGWRSLPLWAVAVAVSIGVAAAGQWLGRTAGSRRSERRRLLPGDELVEQPTVVTNHAITIPAPPDQVWPWLVQMGWHRGGWYTARWVDRLLFPANWPSASRLVPQLQRPLAVGDSIPDGPPDTAWYVVEHVDPPHLLALHSTTHVPAAWRERWAPRSTGRGRSRSKTAATVTRGCCCGSEGGLGHGG